MNDFKGIRLRKFNTSRPKSRIYGRKIKLLLEVNKVDENLSKNNNDSKLKKKPAVQYSRLGLPRVTGRGARMAHKQWLEENGYERD